MARRRLPMRTAGTEDSCRLRSQVLEILSPPEWPAVSFGIGSFVLRLHCLGFSAGRVRGAMYTFWQILTYFCGARLPHGRFPIREQA